MTNEDARWEALTKEQRAFLVKLGRWPYRWFVSDERYASVWARMEKENRLAAKKEQEAKQRDYWAAVAGRVTTYTGPDYRALNNDRWIRVSERQYEQTPEDRRSIGVPEPVAA